MSCEHFITPYKKKIKLKCIKTLNLRPESIKLLEENIDRTLSYVNHIKILFDPLPRVMEIKTKINKLDCIKLKSFCTIKETKSQAKRQPSEQEKIIENKIIHKELISKICKQLMQLKSRNK